MSAPHPAAAPVRVPGVSGAAEIPRSDHAERGLLELSGPAVAAGWLAIPAAAAALAVALAAFLAPLTRALTIVPGPSQMPLPLAAADVRPEPNEQALYVIALVVPPVVVWALCLAAGRVRRPGAALPRAAVTVQLAITIAIVSTCVYQASVVHAYFLSVRTALGLAATGAILAGAWGWRRSEALRPWRESAAGGQVLRVSGPIATAAAIAYTVARLGSVVFDDASIVASPATVSYHLPFTLAEFAAVMNGRTPGVDFFPTYASLLPYALAPVFRFTGLTVKSFTIAMATLSFIALMLQYDVLRRVTGRSWVALALYVPFVALAFHPVEVFPSGDIATAFNYFAVGPLRYLGPSVVAWLVAWHLSRPSGWRASVVFVAAGASALNNLDFGVPALGGAALALALTGRSALLPRRHPLLTVVGASIAGVAVAFVAFQCVSYVHSGGLVSISDMTVFQRAYAVVGFGMIPLPRWGLHWIVYGTFMLGLGTAVVRLAALRLADRSCPDAVATRERLLAGVLLYGSVFGAGALAYYIGRSHHAVLPAVFAAWGSILVLLSWLALRAAPGAWRGRRIAVVPGVMAVGAFALCAGEAMPFPFPEANLYEGVPHLGAEKVRSVVEAPLAAARLRTSVAPGEKVMLGSPVGHLVAHLAGVDNVFPFTEWGSCIVVGHVEEIVARMRLNGVTKYFGPAPPELRARVAAEGLDVTFLEAPRPDP